MSGTGKVLGASTTVGTGAVVLPNTGGNLIVTIALSVAAGLAVWGVMYALANRKTA